MIVTTALLTTCLKILLIPSYFSTDFEVHRNWLAITSSLPVEKWYFAENSPWTLDYPPLFAWFEYCLSFIGKLFDENMLQIDNLNYASDRTILFQRLSVIVADLVFVYGVYKCKSSLKRCWKNDVVLPILLITNCGLLMVDHIHFQYNGFLYGILLLSLAEMSRNNFLKSAFWFTILLNFKHIYLYLSPAYFVYLLRHYCLKSGPFPRKINNQNCLKLFVLLLGIFGTTFWPFRRQIGQVLTRLFPFKRGLVHAYWAPNFWALYNFTDKILYVLCVKFQIVQVKGEVASMTGGLVQEFSHQILPDITPKTTILLTGIFLLVPMLKLFILERKWNNFVRFLVLCALTSFQFGWHVHEKAILMAILPLTLLAVSDLFHAKIYLILSIFGHYSLFPLLFPNNLLVIKVLLLLLHSIYAFHSLSKVFPSLFCRSSLPLLNQWESLFLIGLVGVFLYENFLHKILGLDQKFAFLPLLITSVYCSLGVTYCWLKLYINFVLGHTTTKKIN